MTHNKDKNPPGKVNGARLNHAPQNSHNNNHNDDDFNRAPVDVQGEPIDRLDPDYTAKVMLAEVRARLATGKTKPGEKVADDIHPGFRLRKCNTLRDKAAVILECIDKDYHTLLQYPEIHAVRRGLERISKTNGKDPQPVTYKSYKGVIALISKCEKLEGDRFGPLSGSLHQFIDLLKIHDVIVTDPNIAAAAAKNGYHSI